MHLQDRSRLHQCVFFLIVIAIAIVLGISLRDVTRARFELIAVKCDVRQWRSHGGGGQKGKVSQLLSGQVTGTVEIREENLGGGGGVQVGPNVAFGSTK